MQTLYDFFNGTFNMYFLSSDKNIITNIIAWICYVTRSRKRWKDRQAVAVILRLYYLNTPFYALFFKFSKF